MYVHVCTDMFVCVHVDVSECVCVCARANRRVWMSEVAGCHSSGTIHLVFLRQCSP